MTVTIAILIGVVNFTKPKISIIEEESYYDSYKIEDNKVMIKCYITIDNRNNQDKIINIYGLFPEDAKGGLLKKEKLIASVDTDTSFTLPSNDKKGFEVNFIGDYAGNNVKSNRMLPEIMIETRN